MQLSVIRNAVPAYHGGDVDYYFICFGIGLLMRKYQETDFRLEQNHQYNNLTNLIFRGVVQISSDPFEIVFIKIKDQFPHYVNNRDRIGAYKKWMH